MTPHLLHYVWVGGRPKPPALLARLARWRVALPGYEIREWNEQSLDLSANRYAREALQAGAYAFVSDYVRLFALYHEGGVYCDTDVEVLKSFDALLDGTTTFGFEAGPAVASSTIIAARQCPFIGGLLAAYDDRAFLDADCNRDETTNVAVITKELVRAGLRLEDREQTVSLCGTTVRLVPSLWLSPYDYLRGIDRRGAQSMAVHLFEGSWLGWSGQFRVRLGRLIRRLKGVVKSGVPCPTSPRCGQKP